MEMNQITPQLLFVLIIVIIIIIYYALIGRYWLKAVLSGVRIKPIEILFMRMRGTPVNKVITELIKAHKSGILLRRDELEACHLAGGDVKNVVEGLIYAKAKDIEFTIQDAIQMDQEKNDIVKTLRNKYSKL